MTFTIHLDRTFVRDELQFSVRTIDPKARDDHFGNELLSVRKPARWSALLEVLRDETERPTIVYAQSRKETERLADELTTALGIECLAYHAGLMADARLSVAQQFLNGACDLIAATSAFGMGIDKGDVRSVVHWQVPATPEALYQEAGRAGRGPLGRPAKAVLLFHEADLDRAYQLVRRGSPTANEIRRLDLTLREVADQQSARSTNTIARVTITDGDMTRLAGMRPDVEPRVALAHLERVGLVKELDRIYGARSLRRIPDIELPTSTLEGFVLEALDSGGRCDGLVATDLAEIAGCAARDIHSAIRAMTKRGLVEECRHVSLRLLTTNPETRLSALRRTALALWHEVEEFGKVNGSRRYLRGAGAAIGDHGDVIDSVEILSAFGLLDVQYEHVDGRVPAIRASRQPETGPLRESFKAVNEVIAATAGGGIIPLHKLLSQTGLSRDVVRDALTLAHLCGVASIDLRSWEDGGKDVARVVRILEVEDRDQLIAEAEAAGKSRARNQLLRLEALHRYARIEIPDDDESADLTRSDSLSVDVHQAYLERYLTERDFLDQIALDSATDLLAGLTSTQRMAVEASTDLPIVILAGPGTGKTRTITYRIAFRSRVKLVLPENILAVTFTRAATEEMRARLAQLNVRGVRVRTLHSIAHDIVMSNWRAIGFERCPSLIEKRVAQSLMAKAIRGLRTPPDGSHVDGALPVDVEGGLKAVAAAKRECREPTDPAGIRYQKSLRDGNLVDFDDLLSMASELIEEQAATNFVEGIDEVYVDEFQDLSLAQIRLVDAIGKSSHLTIVGDPRQAIYEWNGASPEHLIERSMRPANDVSVFNLVENFRSSEEILSIANKTIRRVLPGLPALRSGGDSPKPNFEAVLTGWEDEKEMWANVVQVVRAWLHSGVAEQEIAVLARSGKVAADCSRELTSAGVSVHGVGLPSVRSTYAYKLLVAMTERVVIEDEAFGAVELMDKYEATSELQEALADDENRNDWERTRAAVAVAEERGARDLAAALKKAAVDTTPAPSTRSGVTVTTIHQAKGLEWDAVALVGVDSKTMADFANDEEMCRLIYVAITRTRGRLDISWTGTKTRWLV